MIKMTEWLPGALALTVLAFSSGPAASAQESDGHIGHVVFYSARDGHANKQIYAMHPDGDYQVRITYDTASDVDPDVSPTGEEIVFDSNRDGGVFEIYIMNADGSDPTRLTDPPTLGRYPSWAPDGKKVVFRRGTDIYTINADGTGSPTQLTSEVAPSFAQMPVWSPDGRYIAFMSFREGYCSVFRMNADGNEQINLTPKDPGDPPTSWCSRAPAWSANGRKIFFVSSRPSTGGQSQIFVMEPDGTDVRQLTDIGMNGNPRARQRRWRFREPDPTER